MKIFNRLNKMAFLAFAGLVIGGCGFFGDLFGVVDSTKGKLGEGQSVCNNISKRDIFPRHYGGNFSNVGRFIGITDSAQVEKMLGVQIHYIEIKRSDKESICGFVMATNKDYNSVKLTSQDIAMLEKALANSGEYKSYEKSKDWQEAYHTALKFLKYHNKMDSLPNSSSGLITMQNFGKWLWNIGILDSDKIGQNIAMIRFIHGKAQDENPYQGAFMSAVNMRESLQGLRNALSYNAKHSNNCLRYGGDKNSQSRCSSYISEIRAIKNYAESVLD